MRTLLAFILLSGAFSASAEVFRCTDPVTGKTTFTDVACPRNEASDDKIRVQPRNFGANGHRAERSQHQKAWRSQRPESQYSKTPERVTEALVTRESGASIAGT